MSIRQINQSHRYSNVKYIVKSHNMFGIYHRMRFRIICLEFTIECGSTDHLSRQTMRIKTVMNHNQENDQKNRPHDHSLPTPVLLRATRLQSMIRESFVNKVCR